MQALLRSLRARAPVALERLLLPGAPAAATAAPPAPLAPAARCGPWLHCAFPHSTATDAAPGSGDTSGSGSGNEWEFQQRRQQLLAATLKHVPQHGWAGGGAVAAAAAELGLSPAAAGMLGSDAQLVQAFVADCNQRLERELGTMSEQLAAMEPRERLRVGLQLRLRMLEPYIDRWAQALSLLAQPAAAPCTLRLYADVADAVAHAAGDASTDGSWYTKRAALTAAYAACELYMLNDCSPGFADTWAALERRLQEAAEAERAAEEAGAAAGAAGSAAGAALAAVSGLLRRPL